MTKKSRAIYMKPWPNLTPKEKADRVKALEVKKDMLRTGRSLTAVSKEHGVTRSMVLKTIGSAFKKYHGRWELKKYDNISRAMKIYENGQEKSIEINDSRIATTIGQYHNAVKNYLRTGDKSHLDLFKNTLIRDSQGNLHTLETDPDKIMEIVERIEEFEAYEIYSQ